MEFINEYLAIIDKKTNSGLYDLCTDKERFKEILISSKEVKIIGNFIQEEKYKCNFKITHGKVKGKEQRFFYLKFEEKNINNLEKYKKLLRIFRTIISKTDIIIETLRDDISFYYSELAYSEIHKIENMMRKFILYFMITAVGKEWKEKSSTKQIKDKLIPSTKQEKNNNIYTNNNEYKDVIQELTFGQLGDFLFNSYQDEKIENLIDKLKTYENKTITTIDFEELKSFVPKSNWDLYFNDKVDKDDKYLNKRWEELTDLRNKVAHNKSFDENNWNRVNVLCSEIFSVLESAFKSINKINLDENEKDTLSENIIYSTNKYAKDYIDNWKFILNYLFSMKKMENITFENYLLNFKNNDYIDSDEYERILKMYFTRNNLIHNSNIEKNEFVNEKEDLKRLKEELSISWKDEIINAFKALNGVATLEEIYAYIKENTNRQLPKSWQSTIRRTIYNYAKEADIYLDKEDLFEKLERGKWKLKKDIK